MSGLQLDISLFNDVMNFFMSNDNDIEITLLCTYNMLKLDECASL